MLIRPPLIFDTDVISCFAWVRRMDILERLYSGNMKVLTQVHYELSNRSVPHLKQALDTSVSNLHMEAISLNVLGPETLEFDRLVNLGTIGPGEAAALSYIRFNGGTVSSNNMRDVLSYCLEYELALLGVSGIMYDAFNKGIVTQPEGNTLWANMIRRRRKIHFISFDQVIHHYRTEPGVRRNLQRY